MNLTTLPSQLRSHPDVNTPSPHTTGSTVSTPTGSLAEPSYTKLVDPNAIILAEALIDSAIGWRIHNCKITEKTVTQDEPLPFLYHYDSLDEVIKQANPLTPELLAQFNVIMTAGEAAKLIGIEEDLIPTPWHIKINGSLVVFSEALQLAVRLHWTNTAKDAQQIYTKKSNDAVTAAIKDWQFYGRVDVLYKNNKQPLISIAEHTVNEYSANHQTPSDHDAVFKMDAEQDYQLLPASHALIVIAKLEADKANLPWFEAAILERIE